MKPAEPKPAEPRRRAAAPPATPAPAPEPAPPAPAADAAMIEFTVDVPDAQVFVDRVFLGKAPLTTTDVKPGSHRLNVSATGFDGVAETIDVKPGTQTIAVKLREVRLNTSIDVIHKHRMGNCKGKLVATAKGIRYETTDKDDAFTSPLLESLDIRGRLPGEEPADQVEERQAAELHRSRGERRSAVRLPPRRRQGARAPEEGRHPGGVTPLHIARREPVDRYRLAGLTRQIVFPVPVGRPSRISCGW
ncbi:MAG: PEGA domain-containing protein [Vicinamibacterales bacterium]